MSRARKVLVAAGIAVAVLVLAFVALAWPATPEPEPYAEPAAQRIADGLVAAGFNDTLVDVTAERALVRVDAPEGADVNATEWAVLGAVHAADTGSPLYVVQVFLAGVAHEEVAVRAEDVQALLDGEMTPEAFEANATRTSGLPEGS